MAWIIMVAAFAVHVADEMIHDFLPFYNSLVISLRARWGFFPMPTFSFDIWLGGLIAAVIIGFLIAPIVRRGRSFIRKITMVLGFIMIANALAHLLGSLFYGYLLPGFWSSPILLPAAIFVVWRGFTGDWQKKHTSTE
ncbi:MAG: HXXEE domain-containing protein [Candidatus Zixiibacteriota bacterium]